VSAPTDPSVVGVGLMAWHGNGNGNGGGCADLGFTLPPLCSGVWVCNVPVTLRQRIGAVSPTYARRR
jgi:hypothetical protein